jgi:hypothetical protein
MRTQKPHLPDRCATPTCRRPGEITVVAAHTTGIRCHTRRCHPCAARLACRYLQNGYAVHLTTTRLRHDSA